MKWMLLPRDSVVTEIMTGQVKVILAMKIEDNPHAVTVLTDDGKAFSLANSQQYRIELGREDLL